MSIILDALKRAQEERKKITQMGFPKISTGKTTNKQKWAFYGVAGGLVCLILIVVFFPFQKKPAQVQPAAVKSQPVTVAIPAKVEAQAKVEAPPKVEVQAKVEPPEVVPGKTKPKASSRRSSKPKVEDKAEAKVVAETKTDVKSESPEVVPVEAKPKPRTRSRKPKAQSEPE
ncbi:MAG: hypothetical protein WCQ90_00175, partial [Deltaproteobacteria bacterium]